MPNGYSRAELEAMDRDELIEVIVDLSARVDDLETQATLDGMEVAAVRRLLAGASGYRDQDVDITDISSIEMADAVVDSLTEATEELQELRDRMDQLESDVAASKTPDRGSRTKVVLAMEVARDEAVRRSKKGLRGGQVDYPTVRDIADREEGVELNSGTVYDAFDRLENEWSAFHVKAGEDGPNTPNKQLRCDRDEISPALEEVVRYDAN